MDITIVKIIWNILTFLNIFQISMASDSVNKQQTLAGKVLPLGKAGLLRLTVLHNILAERHWFTCRIAVTDFWEWLGGGFHDFSFWVNPQESPTAKPLQALDFFQKRKVPMKAKNPIWITTCRQWLWKCEKIYFWSILSSKACAGDAILFPYLFSLIYVFASRCMEQLEWRAAEPSGQNNIYFYISHFPSTYISHKIVHKHPWHWFLWEIFTLFSKQLPSQQCKAILILIHILFCSSCSLFGGHFPKIANGMEPNIYWSMSKRNPKWIPDCTLLQSAPLHHLSLDCFIRPVCLLSTVISAP